MPPKSVIKLLVPPFSLPHVERLKKFSLTSAELKFCVLLLSVYRHSNQLHKNLIASVTHITFFYFISPKITPQPQTHEYTSLCLL
jgi:hypothetical protein